MPEISRFLGIIIFMNWADHPLPHFHARYGHYEITVEIETGIVRGEFPKRALRAVLEWLDEHKPELMENWSLAAARSLSKPLPPWSKAMFLHTTHVEPRPGYRLSLRFNNGVSGLVDLSDELWGEMFAPLKDEKLFATARHDEELGTVVWDNGADLAPEFLFELLSKQTQQAA